MTSGRPDPSHLTVGEVAERTRALLVHRKALERRRRRTDAVILAVDRPIDAPEKGENMSDTELFEAFEEFEHAQYAGEVEERWGGTDAYRESMRRRKSNDKADWASVQAEADDIMTRFAELMESGAAPASEAALALAEEHRRHIGLRFYDCPPAMPPGLADMYEADARFGEYFEKYAKGLTGFVATAIRANAASAGMS